LIKELGGEWLYFLDAYRSAQHNKTNMMSGDGKESVIFNSSKSARKPKKDHAVESEATMYLVASLDPDE